MKKNLIVILAISLIVNISVYLFADNKPKSQDPTNTKREDFEPSLSKLCEKSPIKELLEGQNPFSDELSGNCAAQQQQLKRRKEVIKNAIKCAKLKLKNIEDEIAKTQAEIDKHLNSPEFKGMEAVEREVKKCKKCVVTKCPSSSLICGYAKGGSGGGGSVPIPDLSGLGGGSFLGECGAAIDLGQLCTGGGGFGGPALRRFLNRLQPTTNTTNPTQSCCDKAYNLCMGNGWTTNVVTDCNAQIPRVIDLSKKQTITQKIEEIATYLMAGKCSEVMRKLQAVIEEIKVNAQIAVMPPPTYDELCKDINPDEEDIQKKCEEITKKCQEQCTKAQGDSKTLDQECFSKCLKDNNCEPKVDECKKDEDCAGKAECPQPLEGAVAPKCKDGKCVCESPYANCPPSLQRICAFSPPTLVPIICRTCLEGK